MMKRLISLMVIISHFMLVTAPAAAAIREEAVCRKLSYVCVDGPSTKKYQWRRDYKRLLGI